LGELHKDGNDVLKRNNFHVIDLSKISNRELKDKLKDVDGIALRTAKISNELIESCNSLKIISRHGVGYDNLDLDFLSKKNIALSVTGTSNAITVSEHVLTMILYLSKSINTLDQIVKKGKFSQTKLLPESFELYRKNFLILGFGRIGKALAKRIHGFESKVFIFDPYIKKSIIKESGYHPVGLDEGISIADFISIHIPLNKNSHNIFTKKEFKKMKKNCIIINTARGGIINEKDLYWALKNNIIRGAGLDVYEKEPPEKNNLLFNL
jgi:Phosphoglycerate dehydrogenase and related dehydrogenases